jgi:phosphatidate cytidylyltransferase
MNNFIVRSITGVLFVAIIVCCFLRPEAMVLLFALVTGLTIWEFTGLVNQHVGVTVNQFICTVAGVYLFVAMAGFNSRIAPPSVFIPYLVSIIYLMIAALYLKSKNPISNWAYMMMSQI